MNRNMETPRWETSQRKFELHPVCKPDANVRYM